MTSGRQSSHSSIAIWLTRKNAPRQEHRYGPITGKFVLYRGKSQVVEGIQYQNVEEYLRTLV